MWGRVFRPHFFVKEDLLLGDVNETMINSRKAQRIMVFHRLFNNILLSLFPNPLLT